MTKNLYRILAYSNGEFIIQKLFLGLFYISTGVGFSNKKDCTEWIAQEKKLAEKPKLIDISYVD